MVDASPTFPEVLQKLEAWLDKHDLREGEGLKQAMWVTDGVSYFFIPP
jgi:inhibitor of KinA sporulation pathway (predicted exonuclease)